MLSTIRTALLVLSCCSAPAAADALPARHSRHHAHSAAPSQAANPTPQSLPAMVGILTSPCNDLCRRANRSDATSFLAASYVKLVEAAGARVVPVRVDRPWSEIEATLDTVDMLMLPGGSAKIADGSLYYEVIKQLVSKLRTDHDRLRTAELEVWGFCLGMEAVLSAMANNASLVSPVEGMTDISLPFHPTSDRLIQHGSDALFPRAQRPAYPSEDWAQLMMKDPITYHSHTHAVLLSSLQQAFTGELAEMEAVATNYVNERPIFPPKSHPEIAIMSTHNDELAADEALAFVTIAAGTRLRNVVLTMFHPEKYSFEWSPHYQNLHTADYQYEAAQANMDMMTSAVYHAAASARSVNVDKASYDYIDGYQPTDTRAVSDYQQVYFFD